MMTRLDFCVGVNVKIKLLQSIRFIQIREQEDGFDKQKVKDIVERLYTNGKTPFDHFGIDGTKIIEVERRHPQVAKQIPMSKRVM